MYKKFDIRKYQKGGMHDTTPIIDVKLDEMEIGSGISNGLSLFRRKNFPTLEEFKKNTRLHNDELGAIWANKDSNVEERYNAMVNKGYAKHLMKKYPQLKGENRGSYLNRLAKYDPELSQFVGTHGLPLTNWDKTARGVVGLADIATLGLLDLYKKDDKTNFRLSNQEKENEAQNRRQNFWSSRLRDGLGTMSFANIPTEMLMGTIDPNHSVADGLRGYESNAPESLKLAMSAGAGIGAVQGAKRFGKVVDTASREIRTFSNVLRDEIDFNKKLSQPEYYNKLLGRAHYDFNGKLKFEEIESNGLRSLNDTRTKIGNFLENYKYRRFYDSPKTKADLEWVNKENEKYFRNPEFLNYLRVRANGNEFYRKKDDRVVRLMDRINDGRYQVSLISPEKIRELRLFSNPDYGKLFGGNKDYTDQTGIWGVSHNAYDGVFDFNVDVNKQNFVSKQLFTDRDKLRNTAVHEGDHGINSYIDGVKTMDPSFEHSIRSRREDFGLSYNEPYNSERDLVYYTDPLEVSARLSEIKKFNNLAPHEEITDYHLQNFLKHNEGKSNVDMMYKYFNINDLNKFSKKHY